MTIGVVLYCDAGARQTGGKPANPGHVGWGIHGYKYILEEPKKGAGLADQILTNEGYMLKSTFGTEKDNNAEQVIRDIPLQQITPIKYIDGYGSLPYITTNNVGELSAIIEALQFCKERPDITRINILADSKYVVEGSNRYLEIWKNNNWLRQDRQPVANQELWLKIDSLLQELRSKNIPVNIGWVKAHNGEHGNELADKYATVGIIKAMRNEHTHTFNVTEADGYWKHNVIKHPFISHKGLIFNTLRDYQIPGQYYLSDSIRELDLLGKKSTDGAFAFIAISQPDPIIELVRDYQTELANGTDTLILARLDYLFSLNNHREIMEFLTYAMYQKEPYRLDLYGLNKEPITRELRPAKLAIRAVEALSDMSERLDQYLRNDPRYVCSDITDVFFTVETVEKKKEITERYKFRPEIIVGQTAINATVKYNVNGTEKEKQLSLTMGIDLPSRNSIKNMEEIKPKIHLITWKESDKAFRYATVISSGQDKGIWAGVYSNLVVLND